MRQGRGFVFFVPMRTSIAALLGTFILSTRAFSAGEIPTLQTPLPSVSVSQNTPVPSADLRLNFSVPGLSSSDALVQFEMLYGPALTKGIITILLEQSSAPVTVANFLNYVDSGRYDETLIHRSVLKSTASNISIIQGGSLMRDPFLDPITTDAPIALEYNLPNATGTIGMARENAPNSATSGWFFNVGDNSTPFSPGVNSVDGYARFGRVTGTGLSVVEDISALPTFELQGTDYTDFPLAGYTTPPIRYSNLVVLEKASSATLFPSTLSVDVSYSSTTSATVALTTVPSGVGVGSQLLGGTVIVSVGNFLTLDRYANRDISSGEGNSPARVPVSKAGEKSVVNFSVSSNNPALAAVSVSGSALNVNLRKNRGGVAAITVRATDGNGNVATSQFPLSVSGGSIATNHPLDLDSTRFPALAFQNNVGQIYLWLLDGTGNTVNPSTGAGRRGAGFLYPEGLGDYRIVARGDVNNDGRNDLIFQNTFGQIFVWLLNGTGNTVNPATGSGRLAARFLYDGGLGDWRIFACVDVNNDGLSDLVFQNSVGQIYAWFLDGTGNTINPFTGAGRRGAGHHFQRRSG